MSGRWPNTRNTVESPWPASMDSACLRRSSGSCSLVGILSRDIRTFLIFSQLPMTRDDRQRAVRRSAPKAAIDLIDDLAHRAHRFAGFPDRTADHQEIRARVNRRRAVADPSRGVIRARQRRHDDEAPTTNAPNAW